MPLPSALAFGFWFLRLLASDYCGFWILVSCCWLLAAVLVSGFVSGSCCLDFLLMFPSFLYLNIDPTWLQYRPNLAYNGPT